MAAPPAEAIKQDDGSYMLNNEDGSTSRWTRRPDGTWRKPERRKAGWVGELEQKKYVSPGAQAERAIEEATAKARGRIPGLAPGANDAVSQAPNNKRNERKKEQRREKAEEKDRQRIAGNNICDNATQAHTEDVATAESAVAQDAPAAENTGANGSSVAKDQKSYKALEKKLRQISELEQKQASGEQLNSDQVAKIQSKATLEAQLRALGAQLSSAESAATEALTGQGRGEQTSPSSAPDPAPAEEAAVVERLKELQVSDAAAQVPSGKRKALEKKLRQIMDLEERRLRGEALNADQLAKIGSRSEIEAALQAC